MFAAKVAMQPLNRGASRIAQQQTRSMHLHVPPRPPGPPHPTVVSRFQNLVRWAARQITAAPNTSAKVPIPRNASRLAPRPATIAQQLSLPTRFALSRPMGAQSLLHLRPAPIPRTMMQVGLGNARTFATTRPIFQNLVENVPVAARAFCEVGWDVKASPPKRKMKRENKSKKTKLEKENKPLREADFAHYFAPAAAPAPTASEDVMTYLDIPLAPTPTGHVPLAAHPMPTPLLPLSELAQMHATHDKHRIRVASLFRRLDAARVWERGAEMQAFGNGDGLCTVLRVRLPGWAAADVRRLVGDGTKAWCTVLEVRADRGRTTEESSPTRSLSPVDSLASNPWTRSPSPVPSPPAQMSLAGIENAAFVMPTLDFSSIFLAHATHTPPSPSTIQSEDDVFSTVYTRMLSDADSDVESLAFSDDSVAESWAAASVSSGVTFSSEHWRRVNEAVSDF